MTAVGTVPGMARFGMRLPGPFRVGISGRGKVNVGLTLGPFSVSTGGARRSATSEPKPVVLHGTLPGHTAQAQAEGWQVTGANEQTVFLRRGHDRLRLDQVRPGVVQAAPMTDQRVVIILALLFGIPGLLLSCLVFGR